ncbi:MAG: acyl-CoA thioesterase [Neomegalonema sp.]|nr:acyl-CoA thioesterase [Neomegalonema sp.]
MTDPFIWQRPIRFGDCDPARIAYTGRIADFALEALDAFWDDLLEGQGWYQMNVDHGYGMPFVRLEIDFSAPITPRTVLECRVMPERIGESSITMLVEGAQAQRACFAARTISVFATTEPMAKIPIPMPVRAALLARFPSLEATTG